MILICAKFTSPMRLTGLRDRRVEAEEWVSLERVGELASDGSSRAAKFDELEFAFGVTIEVWEWLFENWNPSVFDSSRLSWMPRRSIAFALRHLHLLLPVMYIMRDLCQYLSFSCSMSIWWCLRLVGFDRGRVLVEFEVMVGYVRMPVEPKRNALSGAADGVIHHYLVVLRNSCIVSWSARGMTESDCRVENG